MMWGRLILYQTTIVLLVWIVHSSGLQCNNGVGTPDHHMSYAYGRGLHSAVVNSPSNFKVQLVNAYGNNLTVGGALVTATITPPSGDSLVFISSDNQDGSYSFSYSPSVTGTHNVQILLEDSPIFQSLFKPVVLDTQQCATNEIESGAYLQSCAKPEQRDDPICLEYSENSCCNRDDVAEIGQQLDQLSSQYGSSSTCMDFFETVGCGLNCAPNQNMFFDTTSSPATIAICDQLCNSWYQACSGVPSFNTSVSKVEWCKSQIKVAGFNVIVSSKSCFGGNSQSSVPSLSFIEDMEGGFVFEAGFQYNLTIQTVDMYGNLLSISDGTTYQALFGNITATVFDNADGTYSASFTPVTVGEYQVSVKTAGGVHITNSPFKALVVPGPAAQLTTKNVVTNYFEDQPQTFLIQAKDASNNTITEGKDLVSATMNGTRASFKVNITDNCNGTYTASYEATTPDTYSLLVFLNKTLKVNTTIVVNSVPRPRVTAGQAIFTDVGTAIKITFSEVTDRAGLSGNFNCSSLIQENVFGNGSYCSWSDDTTLMVHLGCSYAARPGSKLTLKPGLVKPADGTSSSQQQQFVLLPPANPPVPQIIFRGPSHASKCGTLDLSAEQTLGSAGLPMRFSWKLQSNDPDVASIYNSLLKNVQVGKLSLPMDDFDSGRVYTFVVTVMNYYNKTATASFDVHIIEEAAPTVSVLPAYITVTTGDSLKLRAEGLFAACDGRSKSSQEFTYSWTIRSEEGEFPMDPDAANSPELVITPNSLRANRTYSFYVRAVSSNDTRIYAESQATVMVERSPLSVSIQGGNRLHTLGGSDLVLDASKDFPAARVSSEGISFTWTCVEETTSKPCFTSDVLPNLPTAIIPSSYMSLGKFAFTLTASTEEGSSSDTVVISVDSRKLPQIFIQSPSHISANPFILTTLEFPVEGSPFVLYEWELLGADYSLVDYSDCNTTYNGVVFNCRNEPTLSVNTEMLADGREYTFGIRAVDSDGNVAVATITRTKNPPPHGGCCTLSNKIGQSYQTVFRIQCLNWEDEDYPIRYSFYRNSSLGYFPLNPGATFANYLDFTLPEMIGTVSVHVTDSKGSASVVTFNVNATNVAVTSDSLLGIGSYVLKENLKDVLAKGHSDGMLRSLFYLGDFLPTLSDTSTKKRDTTADFVAGITKLLFSIKSEPDTLVDTLKLQIFQDVVVAQDPVDAFLGFPSMVKPLAATGVSIEDATALIALLETLAGQAQDLVSPQRYTSVVSSSLEYLTMATLVLLPPGPSQVSAGQTTISVVNTLLQQAPESVQAGSTIVHFPPSFVDLPDPNQPMYIAVTETQMNLYGWAVFSDRVRSPYVGVSVYQGGQKLAAGSLLESVTIDMTTSDISGQSACQVWTGRWSVDSCVQVNQTDTTTTCECAELPTTLSVRENPVEEEEATSDVPPAGAEYEQDDTGGYDLDKKDAALLAFVGGVVIVLIVIAVIVSQRKPEPEDPIALLTKDLDPVNETEEFDWDDVEPVHDYSLDNVSLKDVDLTEDKNFEDYSLGFSESDDERRRDDDGPMRAPIGMRLQRLGPGGPLDEKKGYGSTSTHRNSFQTEYDLDSPRGKQSTKPEATRSLRTRDSQNQPASQPAPAGTRMSGRVARATPRDSSSAMK